ncbi:MAG: hypothetical protein ACYDH5_04710 [Acidimicrobiales bacterium]
MVPTSGQGFVANPGGGCANADYTPLAPGKAGGLVTGAYQPNPQPAFDSAGNGLADSISVPVSFYGTKFALSSDPVDPQTSTKVPPPAITDSGGTLSGNLSALSAAYNTGYYNQGSPKPNGSFPGLTSKVTGTITCSGTYVITWRSEIIGGAFDGFTGEWHLTGTFKPASGTLAQALGC